VNGLHSSRMTGESTTQLSAPNWNEGSSAFTRRGLEESGCVTLEHRYDFWTVRQLILGAKKFDVPGTAFNAYGTLVVR
ncbi:MAG: hypothetical protein J7603_22255, partial [Pseudacidovorax sp.]|nr:hypothetical protein [Pseudacidovorax sp.]